MHGTYIGHDRILVKPVWGGKLLVSSDDLSIGPDLVLDGFYDGPFTNYLLKNVRAGNVCIDVGANIGTFTVLMGKLVGPSGSVTAYEANPKVLRLLRENIALNYMGGWVTVVDRAAYSCSTTLTFHATSRFQGNGSLIAHDEQYLHEYAVDEIITSEVKAEPLDLTIGDQMIDLVKIDVEGAEPEVFTGMEQSLSRGRIKTVVFELLRERMRDGYEQFGHTLRRFDAEGWRFSRIDEAGVTVPLGVEYLLTVGRFSQVVMTRS